MPGRSAMRRVGVLHLGGKGGLGAAERRAETGWGRSMGHPRLEAEPIGGAVARAAPSSDHRTGRNDPAGLARCVRGSI